MILELRVCMVSQALIMCFSDLFDHLICPTINEPCISYAFNQWSIIHLINSLMTKRRANIYEFQCMKQGISLGRGS